VLSQSARALEQVVSSAQAAALGKEPPELNALLDITLQWLEGSQDGGAHRRIVTLGDAAYPHQLLEMTDPPLMLHVLGAPQFDLSQLGQSVAVVGSRNPTPQGIANAQAFSQALGDAGLVVVSGMALGIDGAAHEGALASRGTIDRPATVAVVGTGLDRVYPARHRALAHAIAERGLIVSEFMLGTPPLAQNFPKRNRIIAGLSRGTLVVEAALASGSLVTARLAVEQGKEVFAIPGSIHSLQSRGCHALLREGAKLVESVQDILEELQSSAPVVGASFGSAAKATGSSEATENPLLDAIGYDAVSLDALVARTGWSVPELQVKLLDLELDGAIARLPGGLFQRVATA
jgi:DNA processing protein